MRRSRVSGRVILAIAIERVTAVNHLDG